MQLNIKIFYKLILLFLVGERGQAYPDIQPNYRLLRRAMSQQNPEELP